MEISQTLLGMTFVIATLAGLAVGAMYDVLRITRVLLAHLVGNGTASRRTVKAVCFVEDVLFTIAASLVLILLVYYTGDGQLRALAPVGLTCGFFVWYVTLGKLIMRLSDVIASVIAKAVRLTVRYTLLVVSLPFRLFGHAFMCVIGYRLMAWVTRLLDSRRIQYTEREADRLHKSARGGFQNTQETKKGQKHE